MKNNISAGGKTLSALMLSASVWMAPSVLGLAPVAAASPVTGAVLGLPDFADLVDRVGPAVVNIRTTERLELGRNGGDADGAPSDEEMQEFLRRLLPQPGTPGKSPRSRRQPQVPSDEQVQ